jgi:hypothetical protein
MIKSLTLGRGDTVEYSMRYDFFISYASEDKAEIARPLADALKAKGYRLWYDEDILRVGDSLSESIDLGLAESRYGIVILSPTFFSKHWTKRELRALVVLDEQGRSKILPVWHGVTKQDVANHSPTLADVIAARTSEGLEHVVQALDAAVKMATTIVISREVSETPLSTKKTPAGHQVGVGCVVFIHGLYSNPSTWLPVMARLQEHPQLDP